MLAILKSGRAVLVGGAAAFLCITALEFISGKLFPLPAGLNINNREAMSGYVATLPLTAFCLLLLGLALGALAGGYMAARLAPSAPTTHALVIAVVLLLGSVMNLRAIHHPVWFAVANLALVVLLPLLGARLAQARARVAA